MAAEGFSTSSSFHVPQQSRRDKLRVHACEQQTTDGSAFGLLTPPPPPPNFYDPSALLHQPHFLSPPPPLGGSNHQHLQQPPPSSSLLADSSLNLKDELPYVLHHHHHHHHHDQVDTDIQPFLYASAASPSTCNFDTHTHPSLAHSSNAQARLLSLSLSNSHPHHPPPTTLVPLGPFTGYASILKGSRFLKPAQELLEQLCHVGRGVYFADHASSVSMSVDMDPSMMPMPITESYDPCTTTTTTKMRLISLLEEVYRRYKLYYQQMQSIVSSFESVAGLGNAAPYASLALNAMSKHFKSLKNAITDQLHTFTSKPPGNEIFNKDESLVYGNSERWVHCYRTIQSPGIFDHQPVWRPQRGLPERAVAVLRAWLFEHFLHPYPTDSDKQILAKQTGLSRSQVSNWFINARVRLWKPMVEEIHMLETRQAMKSSSDVEDQNSSQPVSDNQVQTNSKHNTEEHSMKRSRNELPSTMPNGSTEPMNFSSYDKMSCQEQVEGGGISIAAGGNSGVSLTLGLRQNNGASLSELLPMNLARSFGVDPSNEGYIIGGFDGSSRQFGKNIGGYMLHDFVG